MIGETLYIFDSNRRLYEDDNGNKTHKQNLRFCFVPFVVTKETKQSWVAEWYGKEVLFNKVGMRVGGAYKSPGMKANGFTEQTKNDYVWIENNRQEIVEGLRGCQDVDKLQRIRAILSEV